MTRAELDAIAEWASERERQFVPIEWGADNTIRDGVTHIRTLLAEVERLRIMIGFATPEEFDRAIAAATTATEVAALHRRRQEREI